MRFNSRYMCGRGKFGLKIKTLLAVKDRWYISSLFHMQVFVWNFLGTGNFLTC